MSEREKVMIKKAFRKVVAGIMAGVTAVSLMMSGGNLETAQAATSVSGVSQVSNMPSDFARGVDISAVIAMENSGATYSYLDGTQADDIFEILSGAGVNYVRIRIWNNPYDSSSPYKGYGAGNCDLYNAKVLGKRATDAGMKVFIDFHYSDFWADPAKQFAPKAWADYSLAYKKDAVYNFTYDSLKELLDYGVDVGMVQIGNETNGAMAGVGGLYDNVWDLSYYYIYTGASGYSKVVDVAGKSKADGANVLQYTYKGTSNQKFKVVEVSSGVYAILTGTTSGSSCLDVYNWSSSAGGNIAQWTYWGGDCQLWILEAAN